MKGFRVLSLNQTPLLYLEMINGRMDFKKTLKYTAVFTFVHHGFCECICNLRM